MKHITLGTRRSNLALAQSEQVRDLLMQAHPGLTVSFVPIVTEGDKSQTTNVPLPPTGLKGLWTYEMEQLLETGEIDIAVHSLKDVPTLMAPQFVIGAIPSRDDRDDVLISRDSLTFAQLPQNATVGTSSLRRGSQILRARPDLRIEVIRGNVDTRLRKLEDPEGSFAAIVLAAAGVARLGLSDKITERFNEDIMIPAAGQGAIAIQCLKDRQEIIELLSTIHDRETGIETSAERAFIDRLGAGCNAAVGASARIQGDTITLRTICLSPDGVIASARQDTAPVEEAVTLGCRLADSMMAEQGVVWSRAMLG